MLIVGQVVLWKGNVTVCKQNYGRMKEVCWDCYVIGGRVKVVHEVKLSSEYFNSVKNGSKPFELIFDDKDYVVGDIFVLRETRSGEYTGRICWREVTYKLSDCQGLAQGWCILGIGKISSRVAKRGMKRMLEDNRKE